MSSAHLLFIIVALARHSKAASSGEFARRNVDPAARRAAIKDQDVRGIEITSDQWGSYAASTQ